jgi:hypothetical protein
MGFPQEAVMGGGMGLLMLYIVYLMMCPGRGDRKNGGGPVSMVEGVTPASVFIFAGCFGLMIGALLGGVYKGIQWEKM